jgi:hypothetical protein
MFLYTVPSLHAKWDNELINAFIWFQTKAFIFLAYFSDFEKIKVGLWDHVPVCVCVCVSPLSLLGNGSVKIPLSLLGNGSVETLSR